jgi:hypothetical protein
MNTVSIILLSTLYKNRETECSSAYRARKKKGHSCIVNMNYRKKHIMILMILIDILIEIEDVRMTRNRLKKPN